MGLFSIFSGTNINEGVNKYMEAEGAYLLDVRTEDEYRSGHIQGSINLPLQRIEKIKKVVPYKKAEIFVYCLSGARSSQAVRYLKSQGYENVTNIGGVNRYKGKLER